MIGHRHLCEPSDYNLPVGRRWTCPYCGREHESRPVEELPERVRNLPGMVASGTFWRPCEPVNATGEVADD